MDERRLHDKAADLFIAAMCRRTLCDTSADSRILGTTPKYAVKPLLFWNRSTSMTMDVRYAADTIPKPGMEWIRWNISMSLKKCSMTLDSFSTLALISLASATNILRTGSLSSYISILATFLRNFPLGNLTEEEKHQFLEFQGFFIGVEAKFFDAAGFY